MMLGDGCISHRKGRKEAYFQMSHCERQYDYLIWKKQILDNITDSSICKTQKTLNGNVYKGYHLSTKQHPTFTKLYRRFYYNKIKVVDEYIVKKINPLAFAIWFMDDGTTAKTEKGRDNSFFLCTQNFDYANQLLLKKSLKIKYDLDWNTNKANKQKDGSYNYRLRLAGRHNKKFADIVRSYLVPSMLYKLDLYANQ